jgi:hypothetical protein
MPHFPPLHSLAKIVREAGVALNEKPVYKGPVVRDDIADIHTERGGRGIASHAYAHRRLKKRRDCGTMLEGARRSAAKRTRTECYVLSAAL